MCGIAGFLDRSGTLSGDSLAPILARMTGAIRHRGPDDEGFWVDPATRVALGHRRLSILDLSPEGHQPMVSPDQRYIIVFNGEIYNFLEIKSTLEQAGFRFRGGSDTEVMLAAFSAWGVEKSVRLFNGMFAFALWDRQERTLWLSRDRLGKKPLYYGWMGRSFLFGSELKALRAHPEFQGEIDSGALALYLRFSYIPSPYSIYRGIAKLPAGTLLAIHSDDSKPQVGPVPYWSAKEAAETGLANTFRGSYAEAQGEMERLLLDAVKLRMIADVPLGAFLSGGIDSSLVVALMQKASRVPVRTFTIGFPETTHDESRHARAIAGHLKCDHTELYTTPDEARAVIPRLPEIYDEPFADPSQIPTYLVSALTRRQVTVSLSGDGGDELFGGYGVYFSNLRFRDKYAGLPRSLRSALAAGLRPFSNERAVRLAHALPFSRDEQIHHSRISRWTEPCTVLPGAIEPATAFDDPSRYIAAPTFIERMMYLDTVTYLPDDILVKVDRASMAVSLEARCPLLDYRVFEFAWSLPLEMKVHGTQGKRILRDLLYRLVPRELIDRPKQGFDVPLSEWLRGPLRDWGEDLLNEKRLRQEGWLRPDTVRRSWQQHLSGAEENRDKLWTILMFQAWLAHENETQCASKSPPYAELPYLR
jgi:asparagine synthase (glutamine-hydrolysing)